MAPSAFDLNRIKDTVISGASTAVTLGRATGAKVLRTAPPVIAATGRLVRSKLPGADSGSSDVWAPATAPAPAAPAAPVDPADDPLADLDLPGDERPTPATIASHVAPKRPTATKPKARKTAAPGAKLPPRRTTD